MSQRDRLILTNAEISMAKVARLLNISTQAVSRGINANAHYLGPERLSKIIALLSPQDPDQANQLRDSLKNLVEEEGGSESYKQPGFYLQRHALTDILNRVTGPVIWMPVDPLRRVTVEIEALHACLVHRKGDLTIVVNADAFDIWDVIRDEVGRDYQHRFLGDLRLLEADATLHPELLVASREVFMRTAYGFIEAPDEDASYLHTTLYKTSRMRPDRVPPLLKKGGVALRISADPKERIIENMLTYWADLPDTERNGLAEFLRGIQLPAVMGECLIEVMQEVLPEALSQSKWESYSDLVSSTLLEMSDEPQFPNQILFIDDDDIDML